MFSQALRSTTHRLVLAVVVLGLGVFFGARLTGLAWAAPARFQPTGLSPSASAEQRSFTCQSFAIYEAGDAGAVYIVCTPGDGAISFFAQPYSTDPKRAARILSMALSAKAMGKPLTITYELGNQGCGDNCRLINTMSMD